MSTLAVAEEGKAAGKYEMVPVETIPENDQPVQSPARATPPDIQWSSLNFKAKKTNILTDCWGKVSSGEVCAIMGPSGAGKSSLLNVLAGRSSPGAGITIEGKVTVGGKIINPVAFRKNIAYVMQDDALLATATPREALTFSANMRLPNGTSREAIDALVTKTLDELGLTVCADVMIGGALIKGISGGQRKRTSVGVELITNPTLLFLDEPTSGLDSYSAFTLVTLLKKVAKTESTTILCTIHQPSSEVFFLFDVVIFMKAGRIFYQGPTSSVVSHFASYGYHCPDSYNPSDFVMSLCQSLTVEEADKKQMFVSAPSYLQSAKGEASMKLDDQEIVFTTESSFAKQLLWLTHREIVNTRRDVAALIGRFAVTFILNLLFGLIFYNAASRDNADNTNFTAHFGSITMCLISSMFGSAQPIMLSFPYERPMFLREYSTGTYSSLAYFLSKLVVEIPMNFIQTLEAFLLTYFLLGMQGNFILIVLAAWGLGMCSCSVAVCMGCSVGDVKSVSELAPLLFVPQMLFVGFFIRTSLIPVFLRWAQYLCSLKYAMNLIILTEFRLTSSSCTSSPAAYANCQSLIKGNDIDEDQYYIYILLLFGLFAVFRIFAAFILQQKAKKFY